MPSLFRLLFVVGTLAGIVFGGLYILATRFEPEPQIISKPVSGIKIKRDVPVQPAASAPDAEPAPSDATPP